MCYQASKWLLTYKHIKCCIIFQCLITCGDQRKHNHCLLCRCSKKACLWRWLSCVRDNWPPTLVVTQLIDIIVNKLTSGSFSSVVPQPTFTISKHRIVLSILVKFIFFLCYNIYVVTGLFRLINSQDHRGVFPSSFHWWNFVQSFLSQSCNETVSACW